MKIYILDEVFDFAKKIGIVTKINDLAKKKYNPSTIQSDLQSYYDIMNSKEYLDLIQAKGMLEALQSILWDGL